MTPKPFGYGTAKQLKSSHTGPVLLHCSWGNS